MTQLAQGGQALSTSLFDPFNSHPRVFIFSIDKEISTDNGCITCGIDEGDKNGGTMRKTVCDLWDKHGRRSDCACAQSDQRLCCSLHGTCNS